MRIQKLAVTNFRNYDKRSWNLEQKVMIVGPNGSGKTNILEALYLLAVGKSSRVGTEVEMIRYGEQFSIFNFQFLTDGEVTEGRISISDGSLGARKKFEVNGVSRRMADFVGRLRAVEFSPQNLDLITGSPSGRRKYLDFVLNQADREYRRCLLSYEKGLRQRNKILERIREGMASRQQLFFWDRLLIKDGNYLTGKREEYVEKINEQKETAEDGQLMEFRLVYDKSVISESRLARYEAEEVAAAATLVGPHRDDFVTEYRSDSAGEGKFVDVSKYGSRGGQRMAVLWLKLGERNYLMTEEDLPVLLMDDLFSELDEKHKQYIMKLMDDQIERGGQVVMTTADENILDEAAGWQIIRL